MSELTDETLRRIAALAHLELADEERRLFGRQLDAILEYARQVQRVDTSGVPPTTHLPAGPGRWRDDAPQPPLARREALANAPGTSPETGLFKVPRVIGE
jgi:aspartyl-tRNA(Asn)/glutamyl-tRNA(Gln) amidotransferase subunit C